MSGNVVNLEGLPDHYQLHGSFNLSFFGLLKFAFEAYRGKRYLHVIMRYAKNGNPLNGDLYMSDKPFQNKPAQVVDFTPPPEAA